MAMAMAGNQRASATGLVMCLEWGLADRWAGGVGRSKMSQLLVPRTMQGETEAQVNGVLQG
jgi:hypothetical protein